MNWKCDSCGEAVTPEGGYVQWLTTDAAERPGRFRRHGFQIVHNQHRCLYNIRRLPQGTTNGDLGIDSFLGQDGLMYLLQLMSDEPQAVDELIELTKRLQVDGYDEARGHFQGAVAEGVFELNGKPGFHSAAEIQKTLEWARARR